MIPDSITANATMNVTNGLRNALFAYSAAPAACGYFVTSSAYAPAVNAARTAASEERGPDRAADPPADLADERVDARRPACRR